MTEKNNRSMALIWAAVIAALLVATGAISLVLDPNLRSISHLTGGAAEGPADDFDRRVRQYILDNPEVILESVQRFEARQREAAQSAAQSAMASRADEILRDAASPVGGNPQGNVTLVEFFDYNCPYCRRVAPAIADAIAADPQLRVVYKEFPILGPNSSAATKVALAAYRQDKTKYVALHDALMKQKGPADEKTALAAAADLGFDVERLKADMNAPDIAASIGRNIELAQALGINGTPAFIIGNHIIPGAVDLKTLQEAIASAREGEQAKRP